MAFALVHGCQVVVGHEVDRGVAPIQKDEVDSRVVLLSVVEELVELFVRAQVLQKSQSIKQDQGNKIYTPFAGVSRRDISPCENLKLANKSRQRWKRSIAMVEVLYVLAQAEGEAISEQRLGQTCDTLRVARSGRQPGKCMVCGTSTLT